MASPKPGEAFDGQAKIERLQAEYEYALFKLDGINCLGIGRTDWFRYDARRGVTQCFASTEYNTEEFVDNPEYFDPAVPHKYWKYHDLQRAPKALECAKGK